MMRLKDFKKTGLIQFVGAMLLLMANIAQAQYALSGTVTDEALKPLKNVEVFILPSADTHTTNLNGIFEIDRFMHRLQV